MDSGALCNVKLDTVFPKNLKQRPFSGATWSPWPPKRSVKKDWRYGTINNLLCNGSVVNGWLMSRSMKFCNLRGPLNNRAYKKSVK